MRVLDQLVASKRSRYAADRRLSGDWLVSTDPRTGERKIRVEALATSKGVERIKAQHAAKPRPKSFVTGLRMYRADKSLLGGAPVPVRNVVDYFGLVVAYA